MLLQRTETIYFVKSKEFVVSLYTKEQLKGRFFVDLLLLCSGFIALRFLLIDFYRELRDSKRGFTSRFFIGLSSSFSRIMTKVTANFLIYIYCEDRKFLYVLYNGQANTGSWWFTRLLIISNLALFTLYSREADYTSRKLRFTRECCPARQQPQRREKYINSSRKLLPTIDVDIFAENLAIFKELTCLRG